jgi:hypothetical protein
MYELKKNGKLFTSKSVRTGPSSYKKRIYRAAVSRKLRNTGVEEWRFPHISENIFSRKHFQGEGSNYNVCRTIGKPLFTYPADPD